MSKDLQLAAWLTEALLRTESFSGLRQGLDLCLRTVDAISGTQSIRSIEDGDRELRAAPSPGWARCSIFRCVQRPWSPPGTHWLNYKDSRTVGYEEQAKTTRRRRRGQSKIDEGKLAPEVFDKAFAETPKAFYRQGGEGPGCLPRDARKPR